jgi:hypothetical protein
MQYTEPTHTVDPEVARLHLDLISSGDLSMEESMSRLFPEEGPQYLRPRTVDVGTTIRSEQ